MKQVIHFLMFLFVLGLCSSAGAELTGAGRIDAVITQDETGVSRNFQSSCSLRAEIVDTPESFQAHFSRILCGEFRHKESIPKLVKSGSRLYLPSKRGKLKEVGRIHSDGSVSISMIDPIQEYRVIDSINGTDCVPRNGSVSHITFYLSSQRDYVFRKSGSGWKFTSKRIANGVEMYRRREPLCDYYAYGRTTQKVRMSGELNQ